MGFLFSFPMCANISKCVFMCNSTFISQYHFTGWYIMYVGILYILILNQFSSHSCFSYHVYLMLVWNNKTPLNNNYETLFILYLFYLLWYLCFNLINMFAIIALTFFWVQTQHSLADVFSNSSVLLYQQKQRLLSLYFPHFACRGSCTTKDWTESVFTESSEWRDSESSPQHKRSLCSVHTAFTSPSEFSHVIYVSFLPSYFKRCNMALTWWKPFYKCSQSI